jgi:hypothetical protein
MLKPWHYINYPIFAVFAGYSCAKHVGIFQIKLVRSVVGSRKYGEFAAFFFV